MENRLTPEQLEKLTDLCNKVGVAFREMAHALQKIFLSFVSSSERQRLIVKERRRAKYQRRYERIGRQKRRK